MRSFWRGLRKLAWWLLAVVALGVGSGYYLISRSLPDYNADRVMLGPDSVIEILRDYRAAPHIYAETDHDAYFGLGFVHAQDRLWQMELRRRAAQGRLTELFGRWGRWLGMQDTLIRIDTTMRSLDLQGVAARGLSHQSPETLRALEAYAEGVNAWLRIVDEESLGAGAPELLALGAEIEPWRPVDSLAAFKLLAASLSASMIPEMRRARFLINQGLERTADLFPDAAGQAMTALPPFASLFGGPEAFASARRGTPIPDAQRAIIAALSPLPFAPDSARFAGASNAWAVSGGRSSTGAPLLASDPHLALTAPVIWHVSQIQFAEGGVIGGAVPGIPAILIGRNSKVAWGLTTLNADVADLYIEQLKPDDPSQYRTPDGWAPFETRRETIQLGGGEALEVALRRTRHGPVLPLDWPQLAAITPEGHAPALSWTLLEEDDQSLGAAMKLMRVGSVSEAEPLAKMVTAPPQNVIIADRDTIGFFSIGKIPKRKLGNVTRGRAPAPGWDADNDWDGWLDVEDLPRSINPASGVVANANNRTSDATFPNHLSYDWPEPYRIQRLTKLLNNREFHTLRGFQAIQNDTVSEMARAVLPLIGPPLWENAADEPGLRGEALQRMAEWNGDMDPFLAEPLIFAAWIRALTVRLTEDNLGALSTEYRGLRPLFLERVYRDIDGAAGRWCDDVGTPTVEDCERMASLALDDAIAELSERFGASLANWRWGRAHEAVHMHQPFGRAPLIDALVNIRHETGGSDHTILRGRFTGDGPTPYRNVHAGGYRAVYDFADLDRSLYAIATGESGHFLSRHYDDFAETWRSGDYAPLSLARHDAEAGAVGVTRLIPPGAEALKEAAGD